MGNFVNLVLFGLTDGVIYAAVALGLVLIFRATRAINFAQGAMATITTYIAVTLIDKGLSYWIALLGAIVSGFIIGAIAERVFMRPVERRSPLNAVIVAIGLLIALEAAAGMIWGAKYRQFPSYFSIVGFRVGHSRIAFSNFDLYVLVSVAIIMVLLVLLFRYTDLGLKMRAAAFAPETARLLGVRVGRMLTLGWALAVALGAVAGVLLAPQVLLYPNNMDVVNIYGFVAAILGGLDSPIGAVVGGLAMGLIVSLVGGYLGSSLEAMGALVILLVVLVIRPEGLFAQRSARRV